MRIKSIQYRRSYYGTTVQMIWEKGSWKPTDGKWVTHQEGKLKCRLLMHNKDPKPPKDYPIHRAYS